MLSEKGNTQHGKKDITLRDVVVHVGHMGQRLSSQMTGIEKRMDGMETRLTSRMDGMEKRLTERIDALDEDLTATMKDSLRIRQFVGMPVPTE